MTQTNIVPDAEIQRQRLLAKEVCTLHGGKGKYYHIESYGCQMNAHDSEKLAGMLIDMGYKQASDKSAADILIFNTCCVREHAELRVFGNIGALKAVKDEHPDKIICVCGCMMQQKAVAERLFKRFPFVDLVFGTNNLHEFPQMLYDVLCHGRQMVFNGGDGVIPEGLPIARQAGAAASVTIMYGCNNFCTYCIVPYVRGRERSREPESIVSEIKLLVAQGYKEITLLGQNVNSYKPQDDIDFASLLEKVDAIDGIGRIRFMTSHPKDLSPRLIDAMSSLKHVCNHIHLPVQSGSDRILDAMNRRYTRQKYFELVDAIREKVPGVELTTDMIVGFPGETDEDFVQTLDLVKRVGFAAAFTFMYSPRTGTKAASMPNMIDQNTKKQRLYELNKLQASIIKEKNLKRIGERTEVLVEGCDRRETAPMAFGKTTNFSMVYFPGEADIMGQYKQVEITGVNNNSLIGKEI